MINCVFWDLDETLIHSMTQSNGGGYDFTKGLFAGVSVHAPYSLIGLDLHPFVNENKLEPYIQIDTNKRYKKSNDGLCATNI